MEVAPALFPAPLSEGITCSMMPFILSDITTLPDHLQQYWPLVEACGISAEEAAGIGYLTVQESFTQKGVTQRRAGEPLDLLCGIGIV